MLHRPLLSTAVLFNSNSTSSTPSMQPLPHVSSPQVVMEEKPSKDMDVTGLKKSLRPEQQQQQSCGASGDEGMMAWGFSDKGSAMVDGFVDEFLNLGDFGDLDEVEEATKLPPFPVVETGHSSSSSSSALSLEAPQFAGISLPAHDAADLEWVSYIIDDSLSDFPASSGVVAQPTIKPAVLQPKSVDLAPATALFSPPAASAEVPVRAKRSKRGRTAMAWSKSGSLVPSTPSASSSASSSSASSCLVYDPQSFVLYDAMASPYEKQKPKKRGRKPKDKTAPSAAAGSAGERRCSHCGVSKTPQWRAGPLGAKTLCNACGVRYKSGRLLPEYRPACSPQFESSVHSNSHRKVLEMRRKREAELALAPPLATAAIY